MLHNFAGPVGIPPAFGVAIALVSYLVQGALLYTLYYQIYKKVKNKDYLKNLDITKAKFKHGFWVSYFITSIVDIIVLQASFFNFTTHFIQAILDLNFLNYTMYYYLQRFIVFLLLQLFIINMYLKKKNRRNKKH